MNLHNMINEIPEIGARFADRVMYALGALIAVWVIYETNQEPLPELLSYTIAIGVALVFFLYTVAVFSRKVS